MCMFDKFHLTFNFKSKTSRDVFQNKNGRQLPSTLFFFPKCHLNVTCLIVHAISISNLTIDLWSFPSRIILHIKFYIMSIDVHLFWCKFLACQMRIICKSFVKYTHWHVPFEEEVTNLPHCGVIDATTAT